MEILETLQEVIKRKQSRQWQYRIGECLLTLTFLDDALRVFSEWGSQVDYMGGQLGPLKVVAPAFLFLLITAQILGSVTLIANKFQAYGSWALLAVVVTQVLLYTTLFDMHFFLRNAAVIGGLLVLVSVEDPNRSNQMREMMSAGLSESAKTNITADVLGVVGRVLISCILLSILFKEREYMSTIFLLPAVLLAGAISAMLLAGFKAEVAAIAQAVLLVVADFYSHSFFRLNANHWERDLHQYYFFQLLTVSGAMLLISSCGAGRFSVDKYKKGH